MRAEAPVEGSGAPVVSAGGNLAGHSLPPSPEISLKPVRETRRPPRWGLSCGAGLAVLVSGVLALLWWPESPQAESHAVGPSAVPRAVASAARLEAAGLDPAGLAAVRPLEALVLTSAADEEIAQDADGRGRSGTNAPPPVPAKLAPSVPVAEREELDRRLALQDDRIRLVTEALRASRERITPLQAELTAVSAELAAATRRIEALDARLGEQAAAAAAPPPAPTAPPRPQALPFQVLSIELWGGRLQVTVAHQEGTHFLGVGDGRGGWTVDAIDRAQGTVVFRTRGGATRTVRVAG